MALLYVTEFTEGAQVEGGGFIVGPQQPPAAEQAIVISSGGTVSSAKFNSTTRFVRLQPDSICAVKFGTAPNPVASAGSGTMRLTAGQTEYYGVPEAGGYPVAVTSST